MLNYVIYAPISTIMLGFAFFERFCTFSLCEPSYVSRMRPCGPKKTAKEAQKHPIRSNCG